MADSILKQNAGRGGVVIVASNGILPAGEYCQIDFLTSGTFSVLPTQAETPLLSGVNFSITTAFPVGFSIKTPFVIGASPTMRVSATAAFYKSISY